MKKSMSNISIFEKSVGIIRIVFWALMVALVTYYIIASACACGGIQDWHTALFAILGLECILLRFCIKDYKENK